MSTTQAQIEFIAEYAMTMQKNYKKAVMVKWDKLLKHYEEAKELLSTIEITPATAPNLYYWLNTKEMLNNNISKVYNQVKENINKITNENKDKITKENERIIIKFLGEMLNSIHDFNKDKDQFLTSYHH